MKTHHYKIMSYGSTDEEVSQVWWDTDDKKIVCSNKMFEVRLKKMQANGLNYKDGVDFLDNLPYAFRNGYMSCKKVKSA